MLIDYLNSIIKIENFVDGLVIFDSNMICVHVQTTNKKHIPIDIHKFIGKNIFEIYPKQTPETSPVYKAIHFGQTSINAKGKLQTASGEVFFCETETYPIKKNNKIIGAINIANFPDSETKNPIIDLTQYESTQIHDLYTLEDIIGDSPLIKNMRNNIVKISETNSSVLIYGETGTGKEMVAQSIHSLSPRKNKPFISQNCAAIPATLLESIFFGTIKGSYTGAENRQGIFEYANGGTVFLDEINSMDINLQAKLLKAIEDQRITRIGDLDSRKINIRIIAALNKPPSECISNNTLRADLFYRLGSVNIEIPPLSVRGDDITILTNHFIEKYNRNMQKSIKGISPSLLEMFSTYDWPGNVRELKNVIEGAFNVADSEYLTESDIPNYIINATTKNSFNQNIQSIKYWCGNLKDTMYNFERQIILDALENTHSLSEAANLLGISRQSLNVKLKKYHLHSSDIEQ